MAKQKNKINYLSKKELIRQSFAENYPLFIKINKEICKIALLNRINKVQQEELEILFDRKRNILSKLNIHNF